MASGNPKSLSKHCVSKNICQRRKEQRFDDKEMRRVMQGAFVLTIASFIAKVLSALLPNSSPKLSRRRRFLCLSASLSNLWDSNDFKLYQVFRSSYQSTLQKERILSSESKLCKVFIPWCFGQVSFCGCLSFHFSSWIAWMMGIYN